MIKLRVEGMSDQIRSFLQELHQNPSIEISQQEDGYTIMDQKIESCSKCLVVYSPQSRVQILKMTTLDGKVINIPLLDAACVQMDEKSQIVFGRNYDIFANKKRSHQNGSRKNEIK
ncbi:hypothetical protein J2Z48_000642 [Croceifilum oryzae]|uniref:Uncharacterized protein n=1 Tax=Croceifilum oryzae TaxID=1553429 RepID=A0AAJ1TCV4_9BACL|nr:hypothetical protein [Croceifilum oryzae]MDQ0416478.1 hypothetical protein [Croceifilum oryzae]